MRISITLSPEAQAQLAALQAKHPLTPKAALLREAAERGLAPVPPELTPELSQELDDFRAIFREHRNHSLESEWRPFSPRLTLGETLEALRNKRKYAALPAGRERMIAIIQDWEGSQPRTPEEAAAILAALPVPETKAQTRAGRIQSGLPAFWFGDGQRSGMTVDQVTPTIRSCLTEAENAQIDNWTDTPWDLQWFVYHALKAADMRERRQIKDLLDIMLGKKAETLTLDQAELDATLVDTITPEGETT